MGLRPGYKQTEVGLLPEDWAVATVGAEFSVQLGKMLDAEKNVGVPRAFVGNRAVQWGRIDLTAIGEIKLTPHDLQRYRLRDGDLLVCEGGEIGRAAIWTQPIEECYYQKALHRLRPTRGYNVHLMLNTLQRLASTGFLLNFATQTSIAHLPKDKFETVPIPVPPTKTEQNAIADALSDADALIDCLEQLVSKKRHLKQGVVQALLAGEERLPGFTGAWKSQELKRLTRVPVTDGPHLTPRFVSEGVPFLSVNNLAGNRIDLSDLRFISREDHIEFSKKCRPQRDDILLGKAASVGLVAIVDLDIEFNIWSPVALIRVNQQHVPRFIYYAFQSGPVIRQIEMLTNSSSQGNIGMGDIERLVFVLPERDEQEAIAAILSDMDEEIAGLESRLSKARKVKQGMMQELLTGKIRLV